MLPGTGLAVYEVPATGRGIAVTATDPDPGMLAELRKHVPAAVTGAGGVRGLLVRSLRRRAAVDDRTRAQLSALDYVGHLSTVSAYLLLPDLTRRQALEQVLEVLPPQVAVASDLTIHLARKG